jgi:hypothetical protein
MVGVSSLEDDDAVRHERFDAVLDRDLVSPMRHPASAPALDPERLE